MKKKKPLTNNVHINRSVDDPLRRMRSHTHVGACILAARRVEHKPVAALVHVIWQSVHLAGSNLQPANVRLRLCLCLALYLSYLVQFQLSV